MAKAAAQIPAAAGEKRHLAAGWRWRRIL